MNRPFKAILSISLVLNLILAVLLINEWNKETFPNRTINLEYKMDSVEMFGEGLISTRFGERDLSISADGYQIYFTQSNHDHSIRAIMVTDFDGISWNEPQIASFSGTYNDIEPFLSPDGNKLFFASDRPLYPNDDSPDYNLWYVEKSSEGWGVPLALSNKINTDGNEFYPAVASSGNLYFTATRYDGIGTEDIFMSSWNGEEYGLPAVLDTAINSATYEFNAYISPDEQILIFSSYGRKDGLGGGDLYLAKKDADGKWISAVNLGPEINSSRLDYCPFLDINRGVLYFTSNRKLEGRGSYSSRDQIMTRYDTLLNGMDNIFRIELKID